MTTKITLSSLYIKKKGLTSFFWYFGLTLKDTMSARGFTGKPLRSAISKKVQISSGMIWEKLPGNES